MDVSRHGGHGGPNYGVVPLPQRRALTELALSLMPDRAASACRFRRRFGHWPRLHRPEAFSEHMYRRGREARPDLRHLVDKATARRHVAMLLGPRYVACCHLLTRDPGLPWDDLPERFAVSATHGSGMTMIVGDKYSLDRGRAEGIFASWLGRDYGAHMREPIYRGLTPRLIVEESLCEADGRPPDDYKFFCFGGEPLFAQAVSGRFEARRMCCYDLNWHPLPFSIGKPSAGRPDIPRPAQLADLVSTARVLAAGLDFVRVDLYAPGSRGVVFGELTFVPAGGHFTITPRDWDRRLGRILEDAQKGIKPPGLSSG